MAPAASSSATARSSSSSAAGRPVQLAPGRSATIEIPSYVGKHVDGSLIKAGDTTPLWSLDETTGGWVEEGSGTVVASATSPSGFTLRAEVTHFSWWNSDASSPLRSDRRDDRSRNAWSTATPTVCSRT